MPSNKYYLAHKKKKEDANQCMRCNNQRRDKGCLCQSCLDKTNNKRRSLQQQGICGDCKKRPLKIGKKRCEECINKALNKDKQYILEGKCICCGQFNDSGYRRCEPCSISRRLLKNSYFDRGLCSVCLKKLPENWTRKTCDICAKRRKDKIQKLIDNGICIRCHCKPIGYKTKCTECYLKYRAKCYFKNSTKYKKLLEILENQNYICPYSGIQLVLGNNAVIDHIIPKALGGGDNIENLQWVDKYVNAMKWSKSEEEFLKTVKIIYNYRKLKDNE